MQPTEGTPAELRGSSPWLVVCRACLLVALAASSALYLQYLRPADAAFCGLDSGCEAVRRAGFSYFFESPLFSIPLVGMVAFIVTFGASVAWPRSPALTVLTAIGGVVAFGLLATQAFVIHAFCWLCITVDVFTPLAAVFALLHRRDLASDVRPAEPLARWAWVALAVDALVIPAGWAAFKPELPVPPVIRALYVPGKVNVVEFADFECPYCRAFYPVLERVLADYPPDKIRFQRRHVPLPSHLDARPAARAAICAEAQGKGKPLADELVKIDLSAEAIRKAALHAGVDVPAYDACLASSEPDHRIDEDSRILETAGMRGLPTTYVQGKRLLGAVSEEALRDAVDRALRGDEASGIPGPVYAGLCLLALGSAAWLGRKRRGKV